MDREIIIWGTGKIAREFYLNYCKSYNIVAFMDNAPSGDEYFGKPIYSLRDYYEKGTNALIVIATTQWKDISIQLSNLGLSVLYNYLPFTIIEAEEIDYFSLRDVYTELECIEILRFVRKNKKIAIIIGNCQISIIRYYLKQNLEFRKQYLFLTIPEIYLFRNEKMISHFEEGFWAECDLFISQRVNKGNKISNRVSSDITESWLPTSTKKIWISNIYFDGYFPQMVYNEYNLDTDIEEWGRFPYGDRFFDIIISSGGTIEEAIEKVMDKSFLSKEIVFKSVTDSFRELKKREEFCDVTMLDYIKEHYREKVLFYGKNHPINEVLFECSKRILMLLGIHEGRRYDEIRDCYSLQSQDVPVYPAVKAILGIPEDGREYYANKNLWPFRANMRNFLYMYAKMCRLQN